MSSVACDTISLVINQEVYAHRSMHKSIKMELFDLAMKTMKDGEKYFSVLKKTSQPLFKNFQTLVLLKNFHEENSPSQTSLDRHGCFLRNPSIVCCVPYTHEV
jgi:hypothetical protein